MVRIDTVIEDFLTDKGKGQADESGNYRQDASRELDRFVNSLTGHEDSPTTFDNVDSSHLRKYARHLTRQGGDRGHSTHLLRVRFGVLWGWAVRRGISPRTSLSGVTLRNLFPTTVVGEDPQF